MSPNLTRGTIVVQLTTQWMDLTHPVLLLREGTRLGLASAPRTHEGGTLSPASLRDRTHGYGPWNRRSNRRLEASREKRQFILEVPII